MDDKKNKSSDYDELLGSFEDDVKFYNSGERSRNKDADASDSEKSGVDSIRREKVESFSLNIEDEEPAQYTGGVYFSNPPKPGSKPAAKKSETPVQKHSAPKTATPAKPSGKAAASKSSADVRKTPASGKVIKGRGAVAAIRRFKSENTETFKTLVIILCVIALSSAAIITYSLTSLGDIFGISRDETYVEVTIDESSANLSDAVDVLKDAKLIKNPLFCKVFLKFMGFTDESFTPGVFSLYSEMGVENMIIKLKSAAVSTETVSLTFPEGWTADRIAEKLEKYDVCTKSAFLNTMASVDFSEEFVFLQSIDYRDSRFRVLEGYLYPDTYEFYIGEAPSSVIKRFLTNFQNRWTDEYAARAAEIGMSVDDVVTLASIVEREAFSTYQMADIASVFHNRLNNSSVFPTLQSDATKDYLETTVKPACNIEAYAAFRDVYDTYNCSMLPVGAISNPGNNAIHAVLYPSNTSYYYFMHDKNGKAYYASNDSEHSANGALVWKVNNS